MNPAPLLSLVMAGRNDGYMGDFLYRLQTSLGLWTRNLERLGRLPDVEGLVVDFGSARPLRQELRLPPAAAAWVRFLEPAADFLRTAAPAGEFPTALAFNLGLRRARGQFILYCDSDSLVPHGACARLLEILDGRFPVGFSPRETMLYLRRYQVPRQIPARRPALAEWERLLERLSGCQQQEAPHCISLGGFSAGQLLPRELLFEAGGLDESLRGWGWSDNELMLRASQRHTWRDLGVFGVYGMHMEHAWNAAAAARPRPAVNRMVLRGPATPGDWGAAAARIEPQPPAGPPPTAAGWSTLARTRLANAGADGGENDEDVRQILAADPGGGTRSRFRRRLLAAIAAFGLDAHPRSLVWQGPVVFDLFQAALQPNPGIEAFFLAPWPAGDVHDRPDNPCLFSSWQGQVKHLGFAQIIGGTQDAGYWRRLEKLLDGALPVELAVSQWNGPGPEWEASLRWMAGHLAPGGAWWLTGFPAQSTLVPAPPPAHPPAQSAPAKKGWRWPWRRDAQPAAARAVPPMPVATVQGQAPGPELRAVVGQLRATLPASDGIQIVGDGEAVQVTRPAPHPSAP